MTRHLIHIGYAKAGSTFLQRWFEAHPQLRFENGGVAGFRNVYDMSRVPDRAHRYHVTSYEGFSSPHAGESGLAFETAGRRGSFPERIHDAQAAICAMLGSLYPTSRILIVTRGFRGLVLSGYSEYVRVGGVLHLEEMCRDFASKAGDDAEHQFDFDHLIRLYRGTFGPENVIVLPYELLRDDEDRFVRVLEERLGLEHRGIKLGRVHASLTPEELYWYPLISRAVLAAASRLGGRRTHRVYGWYARATYGTRLRPLVRLLSALRPGRRITRADLPDGVIASCIGKAESLRDDPLYAPYAAEYLWDAAPE